MRVLLIEDDREYADTLNDLFTENEGHQFQWVENIKDTEYSISNKKWDIILSDVHLSFHPDVIIEFYHRSSINRESPMIFLTAERQTEIASKLSETYDFPVISKEEIDEDILSVIQNYTDLYNSIKKQDHDEKVSFRKFIARYINDKRYLNSEFGNSLSEWIDREKLIFSKLQNQSNLKKNKTREHLKEDEIRCGFLKVNRTTNEVIEHSPGLIKMLGKDDISGTHIRSVFEHIANEDCINRFIMEVNNLYNTNESITSLLGDGAFKSSRFTLMLYSEIHSDLVEVEIIQHPSDEIINAELKNLEETNELLFQEVHHRVNNNLNVIVSLLNMHLMNSKPSKSIVYDEILKQIYPLQAVYSQLYSTKSLSKIDIVKYTSDIVKEVFNKDMNGYGNIYNQSYSDDRVYLGVNQAISLGLILNELYKLFKAKNINADLIVAKEFDMITYKFKGDKIASLSEVIDSADFGSNYIVLHSLLNKLKALISVKDKNTILIRFIKDMKKGGGSNFT